MISRAIHAMKRGEFFNEFVPCPKELKDTVSGFSGDPEEQKKLNEQHAANVEKYGHPTWYEWSIANWGTKWDAGEIDPSDQTEISVSASFDSAWSPPITFVERLSEMGFDVVLYYYEPGMDFCGKYTSEFGDRTYEISKEDIPEDIDDMFGISENAWDEEDEE